MHITLEINGSNNFVLKCSLYLQDWNAHKQNHWEKPTENGCAWDYDSTVCTQKFSSHGQANFQGKLSKFKIT